MLQAHTPCDLTACARINVRFTVTVLEMRQQTGAVL